MSLRSIVLPLVVTLVLGEAVCMCQEPKELLKESLQIALKRPDKGDVPLTAALRLAITMRMAGMETEAAEALDHGLKMCAAVTDDDVRDETSVEFCRELVLAGQTARARELVSKLTMREYELVAWLFIAQASWEKEDATEAERAVADALKHVETSGRKLERMGQATVCALSRLARSMGRVELAERLRNAAKDAVWKSAMLGDEAEALAKQGEVEKALHLCVQCEDPHMATLAHARVAVVMFQQKAPLTAAMKGLQQSAKKIKEADTRDFALRIAAGKVMAAGDADTAMKVAEEIQNPVIRLLATMPLVTGSTFEAMLAEVSRVEKTDQPMLAEVLTLCCGKRRLGDQALKAAAESGAGWPRVRALCGAAKHMTPADAAKLLDAAARELPAISDTAWHCHALEEMALSAHHAGDVQRAGRYLTDACAEALHLTAVEERAHVLPEVVESALLMQDQPLALKALTEALQADLKPPLRETLLPLLIDAGAADAALAECAKNPLTEDFPQRLVACRLAKAGRVADAVKFVSEASYRVKAEALADIAFAQLPASPVVETKPKVVGMSFHGGWMYWMSRLERMGLPWEIMPFSIPYATGSAGLAAKYSMLGYPGAGGHQIQVSAAGEEHVRDFLHGGGGLFGICAGQLFANGHPYGHKFVPTDFYYMRGQGAHQVQMPKAHPMSLTLPREMIITRMNGDFLLPRAGCDVIGWYDRQNVCAAVVTANYGLGRVVASSPHPESGSEYNANDRLCVAALFWILEELP